MAKAYIKVFCPKTKCYGLITTEVNNGVSQVTNFYEIDIDTAKNIETAYDGALPLVSGNLKPCAGCGGRTPRCCDKSKQCRVGKGELWYQCLYCSMLEISQEARAGGTDVYFLMDESGSMDSNDRREAANAVRKMIQSLYGNGNSYTFVAWGSSAGYIFYNETNTAKMSSALSTYEAGKTGHGGSTAAHLAFSHIEQDVLRATRPVRIIFVTDGGFDDVAAAVKARDELLQNRNVEILAIGIKGAYTSNLSKIGTVPAFSKVVGGSSALTSTFEQIAELLKKKGNNF